MKWGCKLQLNLTWVEGRVRWRDLRDNTNLNVVSNIGTGEDSTGQVGRTGSRTGLGLKCYKICLELGGRTSWQAKYLGACCHLRQQSK